MTLREWQEKVAKTAKEHGFWDVDPLNNPASVDRKLMLIVGELAEAHEAWRSLQVPISENPIEALEVGLRGGVVNGKPEGFLSEVADAVIRIMDLCEQLHLDLEKMVALKDAYNNTRPFRHGRNF